ncbi:hydantoinase/oxoprolinase family protein [Nocardioides sp. GY 10127]|uniref:hydantoinase/oxoprolinase family protein n=1 Tax=Nocardioides sp. GY 10127 TaxID=2569762 RepID=UPI0010A7D37F|nr:hydantoinase/oxoprolinase family protein [Nocardioides sp. GY 10127]TIC80043.1 hydantoinase/oxoprolinase family protein [Nocardioides sp. GY 10127]
MATRFGVDVGGTFTDLLFYDDETGELHVAKQPTTPASPDQGVLDAVDVGIPGDGLARSAYFLHGTTVGLNALIERRGAVVGLITTKGFRDALEIRRGDKGDPYDLFWTPPQPLVARRRRLTVDERIAADGTIETPLDAAEVTAVLEQLLAQGVDAIAVSLLNAYANPAHEIAVEEALRAAGFTGVVSLSHRASGEYREYERTSTAAVNAFVTARMSDYLTRLDASLTERGFEGRSLITRSGGGSVPFSHADDRAFETIMSGPVAGAEGAGELARRLGLGDVITADVGGTSFDTALIVEGRPKVLHAGDIEGFPLQTDWVDVRSIGAGGGSIAAVDAGGLLRVGPRSAGAVPGPACYRRGGTEATTTDAAFYLGMLGLGELSSGLLLDREATERALAPIAEQLGMTPAEAAVGIIRIVTANMANAIRSVSIEQGRDPRRAVLMPFGGAGPLFGTLLADELDMDEVLVPAYAGNFSAWGLLGADLTASSSRTHLAMLEESAVDGIAAVLSDLFEEMGGRFGADPATAEKIAQVDLRYAGQEYALTIDLAWDGTQVLDAVDKTARRFAEAYVAAFGHELEDPVEVVTVRAAYRSPLPARKPASSATSEQPPADRSCRAWSFQRQEWMEFAVVAREAIEEGRPGPLIMTETTTTTYVDAGYTVHHGAEGTVVLRRTPRDA